MEPAVTFDGVWKRFTRGERYDSLSSLIVGSARGLIRRRDPAALGERDFWAVQDVSFNVAPGEALAIIGPNGAGKSTTLKLLTKLLRPTKGQCRVSGRVGSLIEVAAGFHPDLTGRENLYLQGAIMGMRRAEIASRLDAIVDFAGVHAFLDTPVKRYSSGMNARLGFSIAAHLNPDVLIIDEVLSVGDAAFQEKCVQRMTDYRRNGVAIVFVSHNLQAVMSLCDRAVLLKQQALAYGPTEEVIREYLDTVGASPTSTMGAAIAVETATLVDGRGETIDAVSPGQSLVLNVSYKVLEDVADVTFGLSVHRATDRLMVADANFQDIEVGRVSFEAGDRFSVAYPFSAHLAKGSYYVSTYILHNPTSEHVAVLSPASVFTVDDPRSRGKGVANLAAAAVLLEECKPV